MYIAVSRPRRVERSVKKTALALLITVIGATVCLSGAEASPAVSLPPLGAFNSIPNPTGGVSGKEWPVSAYNLDSTTVPNGGWSPAFPKAAGAVPVLKTTVKKNAATFLSGWTATVGSDPTTYTLGSGAYLELVTAGGTLVSSSSSGVSVTETESTTAAGVVQRFLTYTVGTRQIHVETDLYPAQGSSARVDVISSDTHIADVHFGSITYTGSNLILAVPYYGPVNFREASGLFSNVIIDQSVTQASYANGTDSTYTWLTNGAHNPVHETAYFALSPDLRAVLPSIPNPASPYRQTLSNRVVLDGMYGTFPMLSAWVQALGSYDITGVLDLFHYWQNAGYDTAYPTVMPANPYDGGDQGLQQLSAAAARNGALFAVHENYTDFYPNASDFTYGDVSQDSTGTPLRGYLSPKGIQSYQMTIAGALKYSAQFSPQIHARYGTTAAFLDVRSNACPWYAVDYRSTQAGAGKQVTVFNGAAALWNTLRKAHGGPVIGEGGSHWYYSGLLDGVDAQVTQGAPTSGTSMNQPLLVDFDLTRIHPLQVNHGMGYYWRWRSANASVQIPPTSAMRDQYRTQQIAFGHAGYVGEELTGDLPFIFQEYHLVEPVTAAYGTANPTSILYDVDGSMVDVNAATSAGSAFDRVEVTYNNGLTVWANERPAVWDMTVGSTQVAIPQYGWLASSSSLLAYTGIVQNAVVDYARTPTSLYVNARSIPYGTLVTPAVSGFADTAARQFAISVSWQVGAPIAPGAKASIGVFPKMSTTPVLSIPLGISTLPGQWPAGYTTAGAVSNITLPANLADGTYDIRAGLIGAGSAIVLDGPADAAGNVTFATLIVSNNGATIAIKRLDRVNPTGQAINFGCAETSGSFELNRKAAGSWNLVPLPRGTVFPIQINGPAIDPAWTSLAVTALDASDNPLGSVPVSSPSAGQFVFQVNTIPNATSYELTPE